MDKKYADGFYPALLKYWRNQRGMSQIDLAYSASVSSRHISFLETGRSQPSCEMVLCLASTMDLSMRVKNEMLVAAGYPPAFRHSLLDDETSISGVQTALDLILDRQEPFPVFVMDGCFDIVRTNTSAKKFLSLICSNPSLLGETPNGYNVFLHPDLGRDSVRDWPEVAALLVGLLHRKVLQCPGNNALKELLETILNLPDINQNWRTLHLDTPATGVFTFHFETDEFEGAFLTTLTTFIAPNNITLEELAIESYYPLDEQTSRECYKKLAVSRQ